MKDVADAAGVSQATVSLVLNDVAGSGIADATAVRVRAAADRLGYRHNAMARSLKLQRSNTVGFVSENITTSPHAGGMVQGAQDAARDAGKHLLIVNVEYAPDEPHKVSEQRAIVELLERRVDGIVFASMFHRVLDVPDVLHETASVLLDAVASDGSIPSVVPDEIRAARVATDVLLDAGHTRIVHLSRGVGPPAVELRRQGYRAALAERGLTESGCPIVESADTTPDAYRQSLGILSGPDRPTAVFCFNDEMAFGVYQAASDLELRVGVDLSVVGFDDVPLIAPALRPGLTTMRLPHYEMASWAVRHLLGVPDAEAATSRDGVAQVLVECPLVERGSVGPVP